MRKMVKSDTMAINGQNYVPYFLLELSVFLSSRLFVFESTNPFAFAVMAVIAFTPAYFASVPFFLLGILISGGLMYVHKFLIFAVCMGAVHILFKNESNFPVIKKAALGSMSLLLANMLDLLITDISAFKLIFYIGEILLCGAGVIILENSAETILNNNTRESLTKSETISVALLAATAVSGAATFGQWSVIFTPAAAFMYVTFIMSFQSDISSQEYGEYIKNCIKSRLDDFAGAFERLASAFSELSQTAVSAEKTANEAVESIAAKVCEGCENHNYCWITNFYTTYKEIDGLFSLYEKSGSISSEEMHSELADFCPRKQELCNGIADYVNLLNINISWQKKNIESRNLISQQFKNVSALMTQLSENVIDNTFADSEMARFLSAKFSEKGIKTYSVTVLKDREDQREILINIPACYGMRKCTKKIIPIVNECLNTRFVRSCNQCVTGHCDGKGVCSLKLCEKQRFRISWYAAKEVKSGSQVSGDNYTMLTMTDGRFMAALSDAMGSGNGASMESAATVELFEDFVNAGFERNMAVDMINSALVLKSERDSFSTLDSVIINLRSGNSEFIKICAAPTFIKHNDTVQVIKSSSLPVGILPSADSHTSIRRLSHNDVLVMVTDGVTDVIDTNELREFIAAMDTANPRTIANSVADAVKERSNGKINDDITVLAIRFWEREE